MIDYLSHFAPLSSPKYNPDQASTAFQQIKRIQDQGWIVGLPLVAVGEAVQIIIRDYNNDNQERLFGELRRKIAGLEIKICKVPREGERELSSLIREIRSHDSYIGTTDIILIASSMLEKECTAFLTFDGAIIDSEGLERLVKSHLSRKRHFLISERMH